MPAKISIRLAVPGDEAALSLLGQATFLETFAGILDGVDIAAHCTVQHAAEVYRGWLQDSGMRIWLAEIEPGYAPIAYLVLGPAKLPIEAPRAGDLEIKRIYLLHRFQGQGVGQSLMAQALAQARARGAQQVLLGVYGQNHDAIAFYRRCGFSQVGRRTFRVGHHDYEDVILGIELSAPV